LRYRAIVPVLVALLALALAASASAVTQRPYEETFGSAEQPVIGSASGVVVDQETGDVLIADNQTQSIRRFHADGTPAPYTGLGTNEIDGKKANDKTCAEEPASCDATPEEGLQLGANTFQIAIDESEGPTAGDIYLTQSGVINEGFVDIFAGDGHYLGQLTKVDERPFDGAPAAVTVDESGVLYLGTSLGILYRYRPTANPVVESDLISTVHVPGNFIGLKEFELGTGPTAGSLFAAGIFTREEGSSRGGFPVGLQIDKETGQVLSEFGKENELRGWITVNPDTGNVLTGDGLEYEFQNGSEPVRVGRILFKGELRGGLAFGAADEVIAGELFPTAVSVYGPPATVPTVTTEPAEGVTGTRASLTGTVDPDSGPPVTKCVFEYGKAGESGGVFTEVVINYEDEVACEGLDPSEPSTVHALLTGLESNAGWYGFRLVTFTENGREETEGRTFKTAATVATEPATAVTQGTATLNGVVRPEESAFTECFFEYGLATSATFESKAPCNPSGPAIPADFSPHEVSAKISGLQSGLEYRFRLVATNPAAGTVAGEEEHFGTFGVPRVVEVRSSNQSQSSVVLEAKINPSGFGTSYRFEWGQTPLYGNVAPLEFAPFIGSGTEPILVQATISGLSAGGAYHYRVTATSNKGVTRSPDQIAETLNACEMPEGRCFELVSRREAGPVAIPGESNAHIELHFQAATGGTGGLAYPVESGYPEATKGADVLYRAFRGANEWESSQLSAPILALNERPGVESQSNATLWISNDLSCAFTGSVQPLTPNPSMKLVLEYGGSNLYRVNPDNSFTPITTLAPSNAERENAGIDYNVVGASQNCQTAYFTTGYTYSGIPTKSNGESNVYEWRDGTLRNAGIVPGPHGEVAVAATPGAGSEDTQNVASEDGSRFFFTATRLTSENSEELEREAIFVREDGRETRDVSLSETSVPDLGAHYQWATPDGSKVFFTANSGLAEGTTGSGRPCTVATGEGCDLYEYNLETEKLTDRSPTSAPGGAEVLGFLAGATDGSRVFFASRNQLVPGSGPSRLQNERSNSYSIYGAKGGEFGFAGTFKAKDANQLLIHQQSTWTAQATPDGRYLLFESSNNVTEYNSEGDFEAYLYEAEGPSRGTICVSCRQDGGPPLERSEGYTPLARNIQLWNPAHPPRYLTERSGEPQVFFTSPDVLAPKSTEGQNTIYEWSHNQVFRLASSQKEAQKPPFAGFGTLFGGAGDEGSDVYLITAETLTWEDGDERLSAYDDRIGGGFPEPPPAPEACDATSEEAKTTCLGSSPGVAATPPAGTASDVGAQNFEPKKKSPPKKKPKKHKKNHGKKHKKKAKSKKKTSKKTKRPTNANRRNGK
jgi:hypothetical protein